MTNQQPGAQLSPALRFARLLRELHQFLAAGLDDSEQAETIRDQMDGVWLDLSPKEQDRLQWLSEDLYVLAEGGVKGVAMQPEARATYGQAVRSAFTARDWDGLLNLLRRPPADVVAGDVAALQAECWEQLGDPETALVFRDKAGRLSQGDNGVLLQQVLARLGGLAETVRAPVAGGN
jgi:hypothetical protein